MEDSIEFDQNSEPIFEDPNLRDPEKTTPYRLDFSNMMSKLGAEPPKNKKIDNTESKISISAEDYTPIIKELSMFKFSSNDAVKKEQINSFVSSIKGVINRENTKKVARINLQENNMCKVSFGIDSNNILIGTYVVLGIKIRVLISGSFTGDEKIIPDISEDFKVKIILNGKDVSSNFNIKTER